MLSKSLSKRLELQHETIVELIADLSQKELSRRKNPEKWSIAENIAHLGRYQEIFKDRIKQILREDNPEFDRYVASQDDQFESWTKYSTVRTIEMINKNRKELVQMLNNLTEKGLVKSGKHPKLGQMNIPEWTEFFLLHEAHHLYTIFWLRNRLDS